VIFPWSVCCPQSAVRGQPWDGA